MSITYNGASIDNVVYNGTTLDYIYFNGTLIYENWKEYKSSDFEYAYAMMPSNDYSWKIYYATSKKLSYGIKPRKIEITAKILNNDSYSQGYSEGAVIEGYDGKQWVRLATFGLDVDGNGSASEKTFTYTTNTDTLYYQFRYGSKCKHYEPLESKASHVYGHVSRYVKKG